jgi:uncharacterized membrane protein
MKKYSIVVTEVLSRIVEVEAKDAEEAMTTVRSMYRNCDIVLDASNYEFTNFSVKDD